MSRTYHCKKEFLKNKESSVAARSKTSRHLDGTRAKGLRKEMKGYLDYKGLKDRFGDAYEQSSRLHRLKRWIKHAVRAKGKRKVVATQEEIVHLGSRERSVSSSLSIPS